MLIISSSLLGAFLFAVKKRPGFQKIKLFVKNVSILNNNSAYIENIITT